MTRIAQLAGLPIAQYDSPNKGGAMSGHRGVVLHIAQGYYQGTINWQMNPNQTYSDGTKVNTCSTFVVGRERGEWAQMVDTDLIAWCQRAGSRTWMSIELAGFLPAGPSSWQIEACARLLAWSAVRYRHPIVVANDPSGWGLGHHSMDRETLGEEWGHDSCPGTAVIAAKPGMVRLAKDIAGGTGPDLPKGSDMLLIKTNDSNETWRSDGLHRVAMTIPAALAALRAAGYPLVVVDTEAQLEDAAGPMWKPAQPVLSDAQVDRIAEQLIAATDTPLGEDDKPAITAAVKQALREGSAA